MSSSIAIHATKVPALEELGAEAPYRPTFAFDGSYVDRTQRARATAPSADGVAIQLRTRRWRGRVIPGWLRHADALKLYELARFSAGDILELGTYHGLSTSILARGARANPRQPHVYAVELDDYCAQQATTNLAAQGLGSRVTVMHADAIAALDTFASERRRFAFIFVDHAHDEAAVHSACVRLESVIEPWGLVLFHDFNDARNAADDDLDYGIYQGVTRALLPPKWRFCGLYGCCGLFQRTA
jgi:predicted O-methyltransferase YrrM